MKKVILISTLLVILFNISTKLHAQTKDIYSFEKTIPLPGNGGFDYLFTDQVNRRLYVTHGTAVHVIDLKTEQLIKTIDNLEGVHGIAIVPKINKGFITDGKNNAIQVFDLKSFTIIKTILLAGRKTDAIIYDTLTNQVFAFNNESENVSVINVENLTERKCLQLEGAPEFAVTDGMGNIYNNLEDKNRIVVIDAVSLKLIDTISVLPNGAPTALAYDAKTNRLFSGCREGSNLVIINPKKKSIVTTLPICKGVDAIIFDSKTKLIFCAGDSSTTIVKQKSASKYKLVQTIDTKKRAKTMAIDTVTHKIYISSVDYEQGTRNIIPNTFALLVYKMN
jgi:DNA-binding beta-propeller fold protein YncE